MAGVSDAALKEMTQEERVTALGMRTYQLTGRAMAISFDPDEKERFEYPWAPEVDFNKRTELDVDEMTSTEANNQIRALMAEGYGPVSYTTLTLPTNDPVYTTSVAVSIKKQIKT